jgi:serine/threonine protein phosphatase PrpC
VGDCRAVLCRGTSAVRLTQDHRPDRKDEQRRIREAGGGVLQVAGIWRCTDAKGAARAVDARAGFNEYDSNLYLSCSRTLGDPDLKLNPERPILSNLPDTSAHPVGKDDLMVVLACDGVWDVLPDQRAIDLALEHWGNPQAAAAAIVRKALSAGSPDNLTAQVMQ